MSNPRYPEKFKIEAVKQVTERGLPVAEVAARLGMSTHSLYAWVKRYSKPQEQRAQVGWQSAPATVLAPVAGIHGDKKRTVRVDAPHLAIGKLQCGSIGAQTDLHQLEQTRDARERPRAPARATPRRAW